MISIPRAAMMVIAAFAAFACGCASPPSPTVASMTPTAPSASNASTPRSAPPSLEPLGRCDGPKARECVQRFEDALAAGVPSTGGDVTIEELAHAYIAGTPSRSETATETATIDDRARTDLIRALSAAPDAHAAPAFTLALKACSASTDSSSSASKETKNDDVLKFALQGIARLAKAAPLTDQTLVDAVWDCFTKFRPSRARSIGLVKDLQNAVLAVKDKSYGPKAVLKLSAPVTQSKDPAQGMDEIQFWQLTSVRLIGDLGYVPGVRSLVIVLLTPTKSDLMFPVRLALTKMPKEAEPVLIAALSGTDPEFATLASRYPEKAGIPRIAEPLAYISRPAGHRAILDALAKADNDQNRVLLATHLTMLPSSAESIKAFKEAFNKTAPNAAIAMAGGGNGRAIMVSAAPMFFDPSMTDWILKEMASSKGEARDAMDTAALPAAIKLMTQATSKAVGAAVNAIPGQSIEKDMYASALKVLDSCKKDVACYLRVLDTPVPSSPPAAKISHVKAMFMAAIYGDASTRPAITSKLASITDGAVRLAMVEAITHLAPQGDRAAADQLEALVESDRKAGVRSGTDEIYRAMLMLRSRAH